MQKQQHKTRWGGGLFFFGIGCILFGVGGWLVARVEARLGWAETTAVVTRAVLEEHVSRDSDDRSETTTYRAVATFDYTWEGEHYTGDNPDGGFGADNLGSYQTDVYGRLNAAFESGEPIPCFVNPDAPQKAVLFNWVRPGMIAFLTLAGVIFGALGAGLLGGPIGVIVGGGAALGYMSFLVSKIAALPANAVYGDFPDWLKALLYGPSALVICIGLVLLYRAASKPPDDCTLPQT